MQAKFFPLEGPILQEYPFFGAGRLCLANADDFVATVTSSAVHIQGPESLADRIES